VFLYDAGAKLAAIPLLLCKVFLPKPALKNNDLYKPLVFQLFCCTFAHFKIMP